MRDPHTFLALVGCVVMPALLGGGARISATAQQTILPSSSSISGRVVDVSSGAPIADVRVTLLTTAPPPPQQTGADGRFSFPNLPPGSYVVGAMKEGYQPINFGNAGIGGSLPIGQADRIDIVIKMARPGVISGTVLEHDGQPAIRMVVQSLRRQGTRWLPSAGATSDDRGAYRMVVQPGEYVVAASAGPFNLTAVLPKTYAPSAMTRAAAAVIKVGSGDQVSGVDIPVDASEQPGTGRRIAGRLSSPDGKVAGLEVRLTPAGAGAMSYFDTRTATSDAQGRFVFSGIAEGDYLLQSVRFPEWSESGAVGLAMPVPGGGVRYAAPPGTPPPGPPGPPAATMTATVSVVVGDRDQLNVEVPLVSAAHIKGRLVFEGTDATPDVTRKQSLILAADDAYLPNVPQRRVDADGTFQSIGLPPGRYRVGVERGFPEWTLVSIESGGKDITSQPVELGASDVNVVLTYTKKTTALVGTVRDTQGRPVPSGRVYLFPQNAGRRVAEASDTSTLLFLGHVPLLQQATSSPSAPFEFKRIIPGDYFVAYVSEPPEDWIDADFLRSLERTAVRVHVNPGEAKTVEVRASPAR